MIYTPITVADAASFGPADCFGCRTGGPLNTAITMAFQPIVDVATGSVFAYEALVQGTDGRSADAVMAALSRT